MRARSAPSSISSPRMPRPTTSTVSPGRGGAACGHRVGSGPPRLLAPRRARVAPATNVRSVAASGLCRSASSTARPSARSSRRKRRDASRSSAQRARCRARRSARSASASRARGRQALGLRLGGRARGFQVAPALLEPLDGARDVAALAGQQPLGDLEGARREAVAARDRQREALADAVVVEPEARRAAGGIDVEGGDLERRARRARTSSPAGSAW